MKATNLGFTGRLNQLSIAVLLTALCSAGAEASDIERQCHNLVRLTDLSHAIEPGIPVAASEELPAHCKVRGVVNRAIRFEVRLPMAGLERSPDVHRRGWCGGSDRRHHLPAGRRLRHGVHRHRARDQRGIRVLPPAGSVASTTPTGAFTWPPWHPSRIISHFYGRDIDHAYLTGCSNGGRAALLEALRFPDDYDGIIAGAPAFRFQEFASWMIAMHRLQSAHPLTDESLLLLDNASRERPATASMAWWTA